MIEPLLARASVAYENATDEQRTAGARWYPDARASARELARRHGCSVARAAAVIAALSPTQSWAGNLTVARRLFADPNGRRLMPAHEQARPLLLGRRLLQLSGQKVEAFRVAIASGGRRGRAVVDRWMVRALLGVDKTSVSRRDYDACATALSGAAAVHGVNVHALQATVWIAVRGKGE